MGTVLSPYAFHARRVRALPLAELHDRLVKKALKSGLPEELAEDLVQRAFRILITDGAAKWDHLKDPDAYIFLLKRMKRAYRADRDKADRRRTDLDTEGVEESPPSSDRSPQRLVIAKERVTRALGELLRRLADNPLAVKVVKLCAAEGKLKPSEIASRLEENVSRIYDCQARIRDEARAIVAAEKLATDAGEG